MAKKKRHYRFRVLLVTLVLLMVVVLWIGLEGQRIKGVFTGMGSSLGGSDQPLPTEGADDKRRETMATYDESDQGPVKQVNTQPPDRPRNPQTRAGAARLSARHAQEYYVDLQPVESLEIPGLDHALQGRQLGAHVHPFDQTDAPTDPQTFDVERGGELIAYTIARQLQAMHWVVGMSLTDAVLPVASREFAAVDYGSALLQLHWGGTCVYCVTSGTKDGQAIQTARIQVRIDVSKRATSPDAVRETIYAAAVHAEAEVGADQIPLRTQRAREAAQRALSQWIQRLFSDPALVQALVGEVTAQSPAGHGKGGADETPSAQP